MTVTESLPETLEVHEGDRVALSTLVNTGVAGAKADGISIYWRRLQPACRTDPGRRCLQRPDVPWVNYFNGGDAVHD